jgi:hypothetical protein
MSLYDHLILKLDADSIALMFTPEGKMGNEAQGRDAIRKFLATFNQVKVLSQQSESLSIIMDGQQSLQKGTYVQTVILTPGDTITVRGDFESHWMWMPQEGWRIKKMETFPTR